MRTFLYQPVCFVGLMVVCLMFAPARLVTGDRSVYPLTLTATTSEQLPAAERTFADLCDSDPVGALARSMHRYRANIEGYTCTLIKQERIDGELRGREVIHCDFRESPFAVHMRWVEGKGRAEAMLYPAGDRSDRLAVIPANKLARTVFPYVTRSLNDSMVRSAARFPASEFGMYQGAARAHTDWRAAREKGQLKTRYDGLCPVPELDGRLCHVLHRECVVPESEGLTQVTLCFDPDTLLQVGAVLKAGQELIASYYFRDLVLNPKFEAGHFSVERLK